MRLVVPFPFASRSSAVEYSRPRGLNILVKIFQTPTEYFHQCHFARSNLNRNGYAAPAQWLNDTSLLRESCLQFFALNPHLTACK